VMNAAITSSQKTPHAGNVALHGQARVDMTEDGVRPSEQVHASQNMPHEGPVTEAAVATRTSRMATGVAQVVVTISSHGIQHAGSVENQGLTTMSMMGTQLRALHQERLRTPGTSRMAIGHAEVVVTTSSAATIPAGSVETPSRSSAATASSRKLATGFAPTLPARTSSSRRTRNAEGATPSSQEPLLSTAKGRHRWTI